MSCLTPPGSGAIATIALQGECAWNLIRGLFRSPLPEQLLPGHFCFGRLGQDDQAADEVVLAAKENSIEIHCHGGMEVVRYLQSLLEARGALKCSGQEFVSRWVESPLRALALPQLLAAPTLKTAALLLDQFHGALERALGKIRALLDEGNLVSADAILSRLLETSPIGQHLVEPYRVVIAGAPNVGKSSVVNALAGFTRNVVSPTPGTTRDVVSTRIILDGWPIELIDTAGLHESADPLELAGMQLARASLRDADLVLWVVAVGQPPILPPSDLSVNLIIINKIDLAHDRAVEEATFVPNLKVSARTGEGLPELCRCIPSLLELDRPLEPQEALAFTAELADGIARARHALRVQDCETARKIVDQLIRYNL